MAFILNLVAGILVFDFLVWTRKPRGQSVNFIQTKEISADLLGLKDTPVPSPSCVLPYAACKLMSADMFLISVAVWSTPLCNSSGARSN